MSWVQRRGSPCVGRWGTGWLIACIASLSLRAVHLGADSCVPCLNKLCLLPPLLPQALPW